MNESIGSSDSASDRGEDSGGPTESAKSEKGVGLVSTDRFG